MSFFTDERALMKICELNLSITCCFDTNYCFDTITCIETNTTYPPIGAKAFNTVSGWCTVEKICGAEIPAGHGLAGINHLSKYIELEILF